jgi:hypothetical protein
LAACALHTSGSDAIAASYTVAKHASAYRWIERISVTSARDGR